MSVQPTRYFSFLYLIGDCVFLLFFLGLLFYKKRYQTLLFSLAGGILYFIVDFGYFYALSGSREIFINGVEANPLETALILLWMSFSYGITNFAYIWILLGKDKDWKLFIGLILGWWMFAPGLMGFSESVIETTRTTGKYHLAMLIILIVGYGSYILYHLIRHKPFIKAVLYHNLIGITVQLAWEGALLLSHIRPWTDGALATLIIDSLIETNLGIPYIAAIFIWAQKKRQEDLSPTKVVQ